jgi:hypothetical protein
MGHFEFLSLINEIIVAGCKNSTTRILGQVRLSRIGAVIVTLYLDNCHPIMDN